MAPRLRPHHAWQVENASRKLSYVVAPGTSHTAIRNLTAVTGRHRVPPNGRSGRRSTGWSGSRASRPPTTRPTSAPTSGTSKRTHRPVRLPDRGLAVPPPQVPQARHRQAPLPRDQADPLPALVRRRGRDRHGRPAGLRRRAGEGIRRDPRRRHPFIFTSNFNAPAAQIDFTNPKAVKWWQGRVEAALELGAEGFMEDFGEQVQVGMHFHNGSTGWSMHNRLPVLFHQATSQAVNASNAPIRGGGSSTTTGRAIRARRAPPGSSSPTSPATRRPTGAARRGSHRWRPTCSIAASAAHTASPPTSAASSTSPTAPPARSCSSAGSSGRRSRRCSASTARSPREPTRRGPTTPRPCGSTSA